MPVTVCCPSCGQSGHVGDEAVRKRIKCSKCGSRFNVAESANPKVELSEMDGSQPDETFDRDPPGPNIDIGIDLNDVDPDDFDKAYPSDGEHPAATKYVPSANPVTHRQVPPEPEPWYYRFLERYANVTLAIGYCLFLLGLTFTVPIGIWVMSVSRIEDGSIVLLALLPVLVGIPLFFALIWLFFAFPAAFILLAVEAGRNLRLMRQYQMTE